MNNVMKKQEYFFFLENWLGNGSENGEGIGLEKGLGNGLGKGEGKGIWNV